MINLDALKFTVDTSDLTTAITEVGKLQTAVSNLNKPLAENARISAKAAKEAAAIAIQDEKVAQAKSKTAEATARATAAQERAKKATDNLTKTQTEQITVLERQRNIYEFMTQGYSKGQATVLAQAKAQGALADELLRVGDVLKDQRKLVGGDPFDKSTSGLISLRNAMVELRDESRTSAAGIQMTAKQYKEFARDKLRIIEISKAEGVSFSELRNRLREHGAEFVSLTQKVNELTLAEKERERTQRGAANAMRSINAEDEKMESIVRTLTGNLEGQVQATDRTARSIANYERNLRLAGITGAEAAMKLDKFRKSSMLVAEAEQKRKVDMLSRALAPQISDVVVSLGSGMNPMTVLLQQGLQVRDLIGLSGVAAKDLQVAFRSAASDMVTSIKGTAVALGSLLGGGLKDAGQAVIDFGTSVTGTNLFLDHMNTKINALTASASLFDRTVRGLMSGIGSIMRLFAGLSAVALPITAIIAFAVGLRQVIIEENNLNKALGLNNNLFAATINTASIFTAQLSEMGVSVKDSRVALAEMAKTGNISSGAIVTVTKAAVELQRVGGIAIEDTVKKAAEFGKEPTKALIEYAKQTGNVSEKTLQLVKSLEQSGQKTQAAKIAQEEFANASLQSALKVEANYGIITSLGIKLGRIWDSTWDSILGVGRKSDTAARIKEIQQGLSELGNNDSVAGRSMRKQFEDELRSLQRTLLNESEEIARKQANVIAAEWNTEFLSKDDSRLEMEKKIAEWRQKGIIAGKTQAEIDAKIAAIRKSYESKLKEDKPKQDPVQTSYQKDVERLNDLIDRQTKETLNLTDAEALLIDIRNDKNWKNYTSIQQSYIANTLLANAATQKQIDIEKQLLDLRTEADDEYWSLVGSLRENNKTLKDGNVDLQEQLSLIGLTASEVQILNEKKLESVILNKKNALTSALAPEARQALQEEIRLLEEQLSLKKSIFEKTETTALRDSVSEAITTGLFEGGKAGSTKLRDIIEAELRKPITVFIQAVVGDILGLGSKSSGASGTMGSFEKVITKGKDLFNNLTSFGSKLSSTVGTSVLKLGDWLSTSSNDFMAKAGEFFQTNYANIGKFAGAVGNALAGNALYKGLSNGYSISKGLDIVGNIASLFGPVYGAIGGLINRAFGRKLKDTGIQGTFSGENSFSGNSYQFYKGGLFSSDKTKLGGLDPILSSGLGQAYGMLSASNKAMGDYIGINSADRLSGFKSDIKFSTNGLSEDQIQKKLEETLTTVADEQAKSLLGTYETVTTKIGMFGNRYKTDQVWKPSEFVRFGETALEALTRLSSSLKAVNTFLENTNDNLLAFSVEGADMASSLVDLFGGVDNFNSVSSAYYQNFFSEQERLTKGNELLAKSFSDLNIALPVSVSEYRKLVESQDLTTESGRETFTALLSLSSVFYELKNSATEAASSITEEINRLRGVISTTSVNGFEGTKASFLATVSAAQSGDATAMANLPGLSQSLETMFSGNASSLEDVNRFRAWLANSMQPIVPAFASGGLHSGGVRLVGENGPELEVTGPSRVYSNSNTMDMLSSEGVIRAIENLNANMDMLRSEVRADVQHNAKTAKLLDRVIPEGDAIAVSGVIDGGTV